MCIMKQSDQILSRRFLCSLVLLIKRQGSVPLFCFSSFLYRKRLSSNKETCRGTLYSEVSALSESLLKEKLFLSFFLCFCSVGSADGRMQLDLCETILKKCFLCCIFLNVVVFILVKMHGICYCTKIEEVIM